MWLSHMTSALRWKRIVYKEMYLERLREFCTAFHSDMKIRTGRGKKSQIFANVTLVVDHAAVSDRGPVLPDGVHAVQRL